MKRLDVTPPDPASDPDVRLMLRVRDGDADAFRELFEKHSRAIVNFAYHFVGSRQRAEEIAQDVFLQIYRAAARYEPTAKFTTWLYRIATHVALNSLRDGKHAKYAEPLVDPETGQEKELRDTTPTIEDHMLAESAGWEIRRAVEALPEKQRAAVILHKYQDMDYREIAQTLRCSESAVKSLLFRAYETLRVRLGHLARQEEEEKP